MANQIITAEEATERFTEEVTKRYAEAMQEACDAEGVLVDELIKSLFEAYSALADEEGKY